MSKAAARAGETADCESLFDLATQFSMTEGAVAEKDFVFSFRLVPDTKSLAG